MLPLFGAVDAKVELYHKDKKVQAVDGGKWLEVRDVFRQGQDILGLHSPKIKDAAFLRWEQAIRYYVVGLNQDEMALFYEYIEQIKEITGLDIKEHKQLKLPENIYQLNAKDQPEDTYITNVIFLFGQNHKQLLDTLSDEKFFDFFEKKKEELLERAEKYRHIDNYTANRFVATNDSITFRLILNNFNKAGHEKDYFVKSTILNSIVKTLFHFGSYSDHVPDSVFSKAEPEDKVSSELSRYDQAFLRSLYGDKLWHAMPRFDAAIFSQIEVWNELAVYQYGEPKN